MKPAPKKNSLLTDALSLEGMQTAQLPLSLKVMVFFYASEAHFKTESSVKCLQASRNEQMMTPRETPVGVN